MPGLLRSSLVGLPPPGRGEEGARGVPLAEGPMDCLELLLACFPFSFAPGDGERLVEGGRRLIIKMGSALEYDETGLSWRNEQRGLDFESSGWACEMLQWMG